MLGNISNGIRAAQPRGFMALCAGLLGHGVLGAVATVPSTPVHAQSFSGLGFLPGGTDSQPQGMNADGTVVVGVSSATGTPTEAFRWTQGGGMAPLGFLPGGTGSIADGVNADGTVVVGVSSATGTGREAFRWTQAGGMAGLGFLPRGNNSGAFGVNADGTVVVGFGNVTSVSAEALRWTQAGGMAGLGYLSGGTSSHAQGVNVDGKVVVGFSDIPGGATEAYRWTQAGGIAGLGFLPGGTSSQAQGVNADGTVVVGFGITTGIGSEGFRWTQAGGMASLGVLPGGSLSQAVAVNADGTVVVGLSDATGGAFEAFRWTQAGGMQSVQALLTAKGVSTTGWTLQSAQGVSADGQVIVGYGLDPNGRTQGWIANLGPACVPFVASSAKLDFDLEDKPNKDQFELLSSFTLGSASNGINPVTEAITLQVGTFTTTIPPGSFKEIGQRIFVFHGVIAGARLEALIAATGSLRYVLLAAAQDANLTGTVNPVPVTLTIGDDCGTTSITAAISH